MMDEALLAEIRLRQNRCRQIAADRGLDALLIVGAAPARVGDLVYLANFVPGMPGHVSRFHFRGRGYGLLLLSLDTPPILCSATGFLGGESAVDDIRVNADLAEAVTEAVNSAGLARGTLGLVGTDVISWAFHQDVTRQLPHVRLIPSDDVVMNLRTVKSDYELALLRHGATISDTVAEQLREYLRPGITELDVTTFIQRALQEHGVSRAFATCQSGVERSGEPFIVPVATERRLQNGDMVHMEINGRWQGYMIDICRSTVIGGPSAEQEQLLETILRMLEVTVDAARAGVVAEELERLAADGAQGAGFAEHFTLAYGGPGTYLGHSIGLGTDEPPLLMRGDKTPLKSGMVITFEPGLYRTALGGARIEDEILILEDEAVSLNNASRRWW
jgi:Xaa-Pro aminopeptidase